MDRNYIMGVDLGGTKISVGISKLHGEMLKNVVVKTQAEDGEEAVLDRIKQALHDVMEQAGVDIEQVLAVGVGTPGLIDKQKGLILKAVNLPFTDYDIVTPLRNEFPVEVYLENDANAATLGEYLFGAGMGKDPFLYITVSTGVGGGAMAKGHLLQGVSGNGFEVGHTVIDPHSKVQCTCGLFGDVESLCSGTAIAGFAREAVAKGEETSLLGQDPITTEKVYEAYKHGDLVAKRILLDAFHHLGLAMGNLIMLYNPETIVIGGGVSLIGEFFFDEVKKSTKKYCLPSLYHDCTILPSSLGKNSGVLGALAVAKTRILQKGEK